MKALHAMKNYAYYTLGCCITLASTAWILAMLYALTQVLEVALS